MAKSKIIKEIANGEVSLEVSLRRALIIASDLENERFKKWIQNELSGYAKDDELPSYRKLKGTYRISFPMYGMSHKDEPVSLDALFGSNKNNQDIYFCYDNISFLQSACKDDKARKIQRTEYKSFMRKQVDDFYLEIPSSEFSNAVAKVTEELLNILLQIDKELGSLDDLDVSSETKERKTRVNKVVNNYIGTIVKIGDNNEIVKSNITGGDEDGK